MEMIRACGYAAKLFEHELTTCTLRTYRFLRVSYISLSGQNADNRRPHI